jgi:lipopolysaccharide transport system permease protein
LGEPVDYPYGVEPARAAVRAERGDPELTPAARVKVSSATGLPHELPHIRVSADDSPTTIDVAELLHYRELLWTLADRDLRVRYKQTALGVIWVVLQPLLAALIFAFVFGVLAGLPSNGTPYVLFAFAGMIAWTTFSNILSRATLAITNNSHILSRIYFPRLILPLSSTAASIVDLAVSLGLMLVMLLIYRVWPGWGILLLPVWLLILVTLSLGLGLITGSLMVRYRDIGHVVPVALQLGLFITPVAWSTFVVPGKYLWVFLANPLTGILEAFRWSLLGQGSLSLSALAYSCVTAVVIFWFGAIVFKRQERGFADVI